MSYTTSTVGSAAVPMPIHIKIVPISDALANNLWNTSERAMIGQKKTHLTRALRDYAENKNAQIATGNNIIIPSLIVQCRTIGLYNVHVH